MSIESISAVNVQSGGQKQEYVTLESLDMDNTSVFELYDEEGGVKDVMYYTVNMEDLIRQASMDYGNDGTIDSVTYFKDYEPGVCKSAEFDYDNDGIIDRSISYDKE